MSVRSLANGGGEELLLPILNSAIATGSHTRGGNRAARSIARGHLHDPDDADAKIDRELRVGRLKEHPSATRDEQFGKLRTG